MGGDVALRRLGNDARPDRALVGDHRARAGGAIRSIRHLADHGRLARAIGNLSKLDRTPGTEEPVSTVDAAAGSDGARSGIGIFGLSVSVAEHALVVRQGESRRGQVARYRLVKVRRSRTAAAAKRRHTRLGERHQIRCRGGKVAAHRPQLVEKSRFFDSRKDHRSPAPARATERALRVVAAPEEAARQLFLAVVVHVKRKPNLLEIVLAARPAGRFPCALHGGK